MTDTGGLEPFREGALGGVKVLDLTRFLAGPFATMILADLGATVIKVEDREGDSSRDLAPYFVNGDSAYFLSVNRSKRSIVLDLRSPQGQEVLERLVLESDVVVDNLRPAKRSALGLDYKRLAQLNPMIIACSLTGFGSDGPYVDRPAYDMVVQALSGVMSLTGEPEGRSVRTGVPIGDLIAGMYMTIAVLSALHERTASGRGQHVDVSMLDSQVSLLSYLASYYFASRDVPGRQGRAHQSIPTYDTFRCSDDVELVVAANTERMWNALCDVLDLDGLAQDPAYATNDDRLRNRVALRGVLEAAFGNGTSEEWYEALTAADVPCAPINTIDRALEDPQVRARDMVWEIAHRLGGTFRVVGNPVKFSRTVASPPTSPPGLGDDTAQILRRLGLQHLAAPSEHQAATDAGTQTRRSQ